MYRKNRNATVFILLIFFILGTLLRLQAESYKIIPFESAIKDNQKVTIIGKIKEISNQSNEYQKVILNTERINYKGKIYNQRFDIQAYVMDANKLEVLSTVTLSGKPYRFAEARNKGQYNEKSYMQTKKIYYKFYGNIEGYITKPEHSERIIQNFKEKVLKISEITLPQKEAGLLSSMLIGDNSKLDKDLKALYNDAGISHIIAISGAHILIIMAILYKILGLFIIERKPKAVIAMIFLIIYGIITGGNASALRAVVMGCVVLGAVILDRDKDHFSNLSFAALILLLYNPMYIYDVGFLLSFAAVLGIIITVPSLDKLYRAPKWIKEILNTTIAAILWTSPIIAYYFYEIPTYALFVNILVLPLSGLLLALSIAGITLGFVWVSGAKIIMLGVYYILVYYEKSAQIFVNLPFSKIVTGQPSLFLIILYYLWLVLAAWYSTLSFEVKKKIIAYKKDFIIVSLIIILFVFAFPKFLEIEVLDVGQGDSIVIETSKNKTILIDGGGEKKDTEELPNTGKNVVNKYFKYKGITKIDTVIVTHPDYDHVKGVLEMIDLVKIDKLILPIGKCNEDNLQILLIEKAQKKNIPIYYFKKDDRIVVDDITFTCLHPGPDIDEYAEGNNDYSLVFKMDYKDKSILFTGDAGKIDEDKILDNYQNIKADILKVGHHGSDTATSDEFLESVKPEYAVISVGNNNYGHPSKDVINRLEKSKVKLYTTKLNHAITIKYNFERWSILSYIP